jgi:hypothetical protein
MEDKIVHPKIGRPFIQNLNPKFLSHLKNQQYNLVTRFLGDLGYSNDMNLVVTITQTQIFNLFICSFSFQGYLKLYPIIGIKSKPFHKCCIFTIISKYQYVLTMICHGQSLIILYTGMKWRRPWILDWKHHEVNHWLHGFLPSLTWFIFYIDKVIAITLITYLYMYNLILMGWK